MDRKIKIEITIGIILIIAVAIGGFVLFRSWQRNNNLLQDQNIPNDIGRKGCTLEAKVCPDGTSVGRTGPNCEFAQCPEIVGLADKIIISSPRPGSEISSPVSVSGKARGLWFFEGSFPVEVYSDKDKLLGSAPAEFIPASKEDTWMTKEFVNFKGEIYFDNPGTEAGYILFKKDNPSDQRELDESFRLPVKFE